MDFMSDQLFDGRRFRLLMIVDDFTRVSLAIEVGRGLSGDDVGRVLDRIGRTRGALPENIRVDNGTEFTSKRLDQWAYLSGVSLDFSHSGTHTERADRGVQRAGACRVSQRELVLVVGRCGGEDSLLAIALQYRTITQRLGKPDPRGVC